MTFKGKVMLITGASSGIGAAAAIHFAKLGALVSIVGRNADNLHKTAESSTIAGAKKPLELVADVTKDAKEIIQKTVEHFGKIDILINNAGIGSRGYIETTTSLDQFDRIMDTNVRSVYHLTMLAVPHLIKTKGNVVNVSSVKSLRAFANNADYCAAKAALDQLTKCISLELAPKGVRVNSINPGMIITNFQLNLGMDRKAYETLVENNSKVYPLGRIGTCDDVVVGIEFLASDAASFYTGVILPVDGGLWNAS